MCKTKYKSAVASLLGRAVLSVRPYLLHMCVKMLSTVCQRKQRLLCGFVVASPPPCLRKKANMQFSRCSSSRAKSTSGIDLEPAFDSFCNAAVLPCDCNRGKIGSQCFGQAVLKSTLSTGENCSRRQLLLACVLFGLCSCLLARSFLHFALVCPCPSSTVS